MLTSSVVASGLFFVGLIFVCVGVQFDLGALAIFGIGTGIYAVAYYAEHT
jgi:hypothetical protein